MKKENTTITPVTKKITKPINIIIIDIILALSLYFLFPVVGLDDYYILCMFFCFSMRTFPRIINTIKGYDESNTTIYRICEDVTLFFVYSFSTIYFICNLGITLYEHKELYLNGTIFKEYSEITGLLNIYLYGQFKFYFVLIFVSLISPRKKDYKLMILHHIAAALGVYYGQRYDLAIETSIVLFLHDFCDVFLQLMTLTYKLKYNILQIIFYVMFFTSHVLLRVIVFPIIAFYTSYNQPDVYKFSNWYAFFACIPLFIMHIFWSYKLFLIGKKYFNNEDIIVYREQKNLTEIKQK